MMNDRHSFSDQIKNIRQARLKEQSYLKRDAVLLKFQAAWQPLINHMQSLAEQHLPGDKRLYMAFEVKEDFQVDLNISVDTDRNVEYRDRPLQENNRWSRGPVLQFYKRSDSVLLALASGRLNLRDIFLSSAGNSCALVYVDIGERDPKLKNAALHPDRMDQAKALMEYWLAKQIALDFDSDRLDPRSTLEITMKMTNSGPKSTL